MPRKAENWLLVEWSDGGQDVVYVKSVLSPNNRELKIGESISVNWKGEPKAAVLKDRSCNREELEAKVEANQPGPSTVPGSNEEGEDFSASCSSWAPSDEALSNDSLTEKPAKKVKLEKTKRQYVNRRTSKKVMTPSHRAKAVIPKKMQNQEANSTKHESGLSGRKRTHNETLRNNSFNNTAPDSTIVPQKQKKQKKNSNRNLCKIDIEDLQQIGDGFRSLFQMIQELKAPHLHPTQKILYPSNTTPKIMYPSKQLHQNASSSNCNANIDKDVFPKVLYPSKQMNQNTSTPKIGKALHQNKTNSNKDKKIKQNTPNSHIGTKIIQRTSTPNVYKQNFSKKSHQSTSNSTAYDTNNGGCAYQSNSGHHSYIYDVPIVEAVDPTEETEDIPEYENEEFNRSDDNVLITNKYDKQYMRQSPEDNKKYSQKRTEDKEQYSQKSTPDNKQYSQKTTQDIRQHSHKPTENNKQYLQEQTEDNTQQSNEVNKNDSNEQTAGPSKIDEWMPIGSGATLIPAEQYRKINWKTYTVATRGLLLAAFPRKVLATHSLTGKKSPAFQNKPAKMCLDPKIVTDVIYEIQDRFDVRESFIRSIITTKCADECKMFKIRNKNNANRENEPPNIKHEDDNNKQA